MNRKTTIVLGVTAALIATAGLAIASQNWRDGGHGGKRFQQMFSQADANGDNAVSNDEFKTVLATRFNGADANSDGKVSKAEIVEYVEANMQGRWVSRGAGRIADRMVAGLDIDRDGSVTLAEFENRTGKVYALADWNDDGKVEMSELRQIREGFGRKGRHGGKHGRHFQNQQQETGRDAETGTDD